MTGLKLHIVSFDVPYPADYGGAIDVFYKIQALKAQGIGIYLHCFAYGRKPAHILDTLCEKVYYYERDNSLANFIGPLPFIIKSRKSEELLNNLLSDEHPILFEGLHSCFYLGDKRLAGRKKIVRTHNVEHEYYSKLAEAEQNPLRKLYFIREASRLKTFETKLVYASTIAAISTSDQLNYKKDFRDVRTISAFHPDYELNILEGKGNFVLYHGNLSVNENNGAALFLIKEIFSRLSVPFIIAGKKPSSALLSEAAKCSHIQVIDNYSTEEITELVRQAHINILPTFQDTGIKLKLLSALHNGRFCLVNTPMVEGTGLAGYCIIKNSAEEMVAEIPRLMEKTFTKDDIKARKELLSGAFSNSGNAEKLVQILR